MTEAEAHQLLRDCGGFGDLEPVPESLRIEADMLGGDPAVWVISCR